MSKTLDYEVVIVGAGPVGVVAANLLGRQGIRTLIIDRETDIVSIPRAVGVCDEGSRILQSIGLLQQMESNWMPMDYVRFNDEQGNCRFSVDTSRLLNGYQMVRTMHQPELEAELRQGLKRFAQVDFRTQTECLQFTDLGDAVRCRLRGPDGDYEIHCRYLVGCDGGKSTVRKSLGVEFSGATYAQDWLVIDIANDPCEQRDHAEFFNLDGRAGVTMPTPNGYRRWEFIMFPGETPEQVCAPGFLRRMLSPWGDYEAMEVVRKTVYTFNARVAKRFREGNVFLMGDAAHLTPPFAGQGLMAGFRDAQNLCWKLAQCLRYGADDSLLQSYHQERYPQAKSIVNTARLLGLLIIPRGPVGGWMLEGILGLRRRWLARKAACSQHSHFRKVPNSALGRRALLYGLPDPEQPRVGFAMPQFPVRLHSGSESAVCLLDDVVANRFCLIGFGEHPAQRLSPSMRSALAAMNVLYCVMEGAPSCTESLSPEVLSSTRWLSDTEGAYARALSFGQQIVFVRPDNMVAVKTSPKQLQRLLSAYLAGLQTGCAMKRLLPRMGRFTASPFSSHTSPA